MIILAAAVILSLSSNGIIDRANEAVDGTNKAQIKVQVSTIWAEEYLNLKAGNIKQEDFIGIVEERINEEVEKASNYDIDVTLEGVEVNDKSEVEWVDIVTSQITLEDGEAVASSDNIFIEGYTYRITIKGPEYEECVICKAVRNEMVYSFIDIGNVENPLWETYAELEKLSAENSIKYIATGQYISETGSILQFNGVTDQYIITKIEGLKPKEIYRNEDISNVSEFIEIPELNVDRVYIVEAEYEGEKYYMSQYALFGQGGNPCAIYSDYKGAGIHLYNGFAMLVNVPIRAIYDIGINMCGVVYENGFCIAERTINHFNGTINTRRIDRYSK